MATGAITVRWAGTMRPIMPKLHGTVSITQTEPTAKPLRSMIGAPA